MLHSAAEKGMKSQFSLLQTAVMVGFNKTVEGFLPRLGKSVHPYLEKA